MAGLVGLVLTAATQIAGREAKGSPAKGDVRWQQGLDSYRRDWEQAEGGASLGWTDAEFLSLARGNPEACFQMGNLSDVPGNGVARRVGPEVDHYQALAAAHGLQPRFCISMRFDVFSKLDPRSGSRLLGAPICGHRSPSPCVDWDGDMHGITGDGRGGFDGFDTSWVLSFDRKTYDRIIQKYWSGNDFCGDPRRTGHGWSNRDKQAICSLLTEGVSPMWYVNFVDSSPPSMKHVNVGLDLRKAELRAWNAQRMVALLRDFGCEPGERCGVIWGYKPGWWTWHGEKGAGKGCGPYADPATVGWMGYRRPGDRCTSPLMAPTPYGPGEYEDGVNQQLLAMYAALDAAGYADSDVGLVTTEHPRYRGEPWAILTPEVRSHPRMLGERKSRHTFGSRWSHGFDRDSPIAAAGGDPGPNHPRNPIADSDGMAGESVALDGSRSRPRGASIVTHTWHDGVAGPVLCSGKRATCRVPRDGDSVIELVVTDEAGRTDSDYVWVNIEAPADPTKAKP